MEWFEERAMEKFLVNLNNNLPDKLTDDTIEIVLKVLFAQSECGIGSETKLDLGYDLLKKCRDKAFDRYIKSDDFYINVFDKRRLNESDIVETDIKVYSSMHYEYFHKRKSGQRGLSDEEMNKILVHRARIKALMLSVMDSGYKYIPILVSELSPKYFEVDDGQGRFEACKALGLPILFIKQRGGMTTKDIINVNKADAKPTAEDIIKMEAEGGSRKYQLLQKVLDKYAYLNLNNIGYIIRGRDITSADISTKRFEFTDDMYNKYDDDFFWVNNVITYLKSFGKNRVLVAPERFSYGLAMWTRFKDIVPIDENRLKEQIDNYLIDRPDLEEKIKKMVGKKKEPEVYVELLDWLYNYYKKDYERVIIYENYLNLRRQYKWR